MANLRVMLAVEPLYEELLRTVLAAHAEIRILDRADASSICEILRRELRRKKQSPDDPIAVITSFSNSQELDAEWSFLLEEFTGLVVYDVRLRSVFRYRRRIVVKELGDSCDAIVNDLKNLAAAPDRISPTRLVRTMPEGPDR